MYIKQILYLLEKFVAVLGGRTIIPGSGPLGVKPCLISLASLRRLTSLAFSLLSL